MEIEEVVANRSGTECELLSREMFFMKKKVETNVGRVKNF